VAERDGAGTPGAVAAAARRARAVSAPVEPEPGEGFVEPIVHVEFPGLRLHWITLAARPRSNPQWMVRRLDELSNRYRGANVVSLRTKPIPHAYRAFFRQVGLDPDVNRVPSEEAAIARLVQGGLRSVGLIADVCLVALVETGVPVWALDADLIDQNGLGIRVATVADCEPAQRGLELIAPGSLVVADARTIHSLLFGDPVARHGVGPRTRRVTLFAVGVDGVPAIAVHEALWICADLLL
jgi:DNA/RNA-binding domain of Phe-tRNA-synthetase-like protein